MRALLEGLLRRWWGGELGAVGALLDAVTAPLAWLYAREVDRRGRRAARERGIRVDGLAVVSVGNLAVGGTGKTPVAAWVVRTLGASGLPVALVARGYGRDELLLHARWNPGVPVVADPDRVAAARTAHAGGARVAVLDDGFQHRRLARDVDVVLLAAEDRFPGRTLPRGPYREPPEALARAHAVVVTRRTASPEAAAALAAETARRFPHLTVGVVALLPGAWTTLDGTLAPPPEGDLLAVAGVARPEAFARQVGGAAGASVELLAFGDHHDYTAADVRAMRRKAGSRTVVVTEKDAVKLLDHRERLEPARVLVQNLLWEAGEEAVSRLVRDVLPESR